jgi:predicted nucleic acid-binding Zn ribbon protein
MKTLVCPHCQTQVPEGAIVCVGCGAEVVRGATRRQRAWMGLVFAVVAVPLLGMILRAWEIGHGTSLFPATGSNTALFFFLGLIGFFVFAYVLGTVAAKILWRSRVRFFRSYRHQ